MTGFLSERERDITVRASADLLGFFERQVEQIPDWHPLHGEWSTQAEQIRRRIPRALTLTRDASETPTAPRGQERRQ